MKVVTFSALKGGVGKSSISIMTANALAAAGHKVLVIDLDHNNSTSFYFLDDKGAELSENRNIALALSSADNNLMDYVIPSRRDNIDIIPASFGLLDLRAISEKRLNLLMRKVSGYDVVIIDTPPTYDNLVLNAYGAADLIITPAELTQFDYNCVVTMEKKLKTETDKYDNWFILFNGIKPKGNKKQTEYLELFKDQFENLTPPETWIPKREGVKDIIDRDMKVRDKNPLFAPIQELAECFLEDNQKLNKAEAF